MAAMTRPARVLVRAAVPGEGTAIASLWRELWDAHETWGGYPGSRDARVYAQLAERLDEDARVRAGHPILGRHVHLVADLGGTPCGQVEGWFERHGVDPSTPFTCEVRSLIVRQAARRLGAGRALLEGLATAARSLARGASYVMAAEVLEPNPAHDFYTRVGYSPVAWNARVGAQVGAAAARGGRYVVRVAGPQDAHAVACLESTLAARRRSAGDSRFDRPRAVDATWVGAIAAHLASSSADVPLSMREPASLVAVDGSGTVRGVASFTVHTLEPPFVPLRRALVGRFGLDPALPAQPLAMSLMALGCRLAVAQCAPHVELTDLSEPGTELHEAALALGGHAWSRVVVKAS
jgi:GNAT superfamily N-acetyltransferase